MYHLTTQVDRAPPIPDQEMFMEVERKRSKSPLDMAMESFDKRTDGSAKLS